MRKIALCLVLLSIVFIVGCGSPYDKFTRQEVLDMSKKCWDRGLIEKEIIDSYGVIIDVLCIDSVSTSSIQ